MCKSTGEPVYLYKDGIGDLVVMDIEASALHESILELKERLMHSGMDIQKGNTYSADKTVTAIHKATLEVTNTEKK